MQILPLPVSLRNNPYVHDFMLETLARLALKPSQEVVGISPPAESTAAAVSSQTNLLTCIIWTADVLNSFVRDNRRVVDILFGGFSEHRKLTERLYKEIPLHHVQLGEELRTKPDGSSQTVFELFQISDDTEALLKRAGELAVERGAKKEEFTDCDIILALAEVSSGGNDSTPFTFDIFGGVQISLTLKQVRDAIAEVERNKVVLKPEAPSALPKTDGPPANPSSSPKP